jgi:hypothetical protein
MLTIFTLACAVSEFAVKKSGIRTFHSIISGPESYSGPSLRNICSALFNGDRIISVLTCGEAEAPILTAAVNNHGNI